MLKVAIVGVGGMGGTHFRIYNDSDEFELVAACDIRLNMLKERVGEQNIRMYTDFDEMLKNEKVDIVDICTPSYLHAQHALAALNAGFNVICEKPMALDTKSAKQIELAAEKSGKLFMVAHVVRFMRKFRYLQNVIESQKYGKILRLDLKRISTVPTWTWENWMLSEEKSGLTPFDLTIHDVDFMQYLFGQPKDIQCVHYKLKDNNDYIVANHIYDGFVVSTEAAWYKTDIPFMTTYSAVFENGYVNLTKDGIVDNGELIPLDKLDEVMDTGINISNVDGYAAEIFYFADCVKKGIQPQNVTVRSSFESVELVEKMKKCCIEM